LPPKKVFTVKLSAAQKKILAELASQLNLTKAEVLRRALRQYALYQKYDPDHKCLYKLLRKVVDKVHGKSVDIWLYQREKRKSLKR